MTSILNLILARRPPVVVPASTWDPAFLATNTVLTPTNNTVKRVTTISVSGNLARGTKAISGRQFWEVTFDAYSNAGDYAAGACDSTATTGVYIGSSALTKGLYANGAFGGTGIGSGAISAGVTVLFLYDDVAKVLHVYIPGFGWDNGGTGSPQVPANGVSCSGFGATVYPAATVDQINDQQTINTAGPFSNAAVIASDCTSGGFATALG